LSDERASAVIKVKEDCILAGLEEAKTIFEQLGLTTETVFLDGQEVLKGADVLRIEGLASAILSCERLGLNFLMRMSGIATQTKALVERCRKMNPHIRIAATRKTTPGFRYFEKKAVILGGGDPHRYRLDDAFIIKDNHLRIVGSVKEAVDRAKKGGFTKKIEIEVENLRDALEAVNAGADIIMLDNMTPKEAEETAKKIKEIKKSVIIEISGGITPNNIIDYAKFADVISLGWLTHSTKAVDFSLEIIEVKD
jgi:nicotinate-nucleotide pyrophosphorylase (carboxylating)